MTDRYRGISFIGFLHQEQGKGFADNITSTDNDHMLTLDRNIAPDQHFTDTQRGTCDKGLYALDEFADIYGMKSINVLFGFDTLEHDGLQNLPGQW